jgi:hypothetical protein
MKPAVSAEFETILHQLQEIEKPTSLKTVGVFEYVKHTDSRNRERLRRELTIIKNFETNPSNTYLAWFLNISINHVELLEQFSLGPMAGHTIITKYKRRNGELVKGNSKLISIK